MLARGLPLALVVALLACSGPAGTGTSPIATSSEGASATSEASLQPELADCSLPGNGDYPHNATALEAQLPKVVLGRDLTIWSVAGWCWVQFSVGDEGVANFRPVASAESLQIDTMQYALAGRSSQDDPPYFVHVLRYSADQTTTEFAIYLFLGSIGVLDPAAFDSSSLEATTIGGKEVRIAPPELLDQSEHARGAAYFYDAGDYLFVIITDDEAWAQDAASQLP